MVKRIFFLALVAFALTTAGSLNTVGNYISDNINISCEKGDITFHSSNVKDNVFQTLGKADIS